jgi:hypothetical protein
VIAQLHENCRKLYFRKCYCVYVYVCTLMHMHACADVHLYYFLSYQWLVSILFTIFSDKLQAVICWFLSQYLEAPQTAGP